MLTEVSSCARLAVGKQEALTPSDLYGWSAVLRNVLPLFLLLWIAPLVADRNAYAPWLLSPVAGLLAYRITVVMHDCTHHTLFKSYRINAVVGSHLGAITGVDFRCFSHQHWRHHQCYGESGDPQGFHYAGLKRMTRGQFCWHVVKPLLGLNLPHTFAESVLAPRNVARLLRTGEFAVVASVQLAILAVVTGFGRHPVLAALPFLSTVTFGLFFSQLRGLAEHGAVADTIEARNVRSHAPRWLDRILLYDVNFNYHSEHHAHPQVPSCHLPALHHATGAPGTSHSMFATLRRMYAATRRSHA